MSSFGDTRNINPTSDMPLQFGPWSELPRLQNALGEVGMGWGGYLGLSKNAERCEMRWAFLVCPFIPGYARFFCDLHEGCTVFGVWRQRANACSALKNDGLVRVASRAPTSSTLKSKP